MAKPLGAKSLLIRDAIKAHANLGNTELAAMINASDARKEDRIKVTAQDVAAQKQALKNLGEAPVAPAAASKPAPATPAKKKPGRPKGKKAAPKATVASAPAAKPAGTASGQDDVVEAMAAIKDLVQRFGAGRVKKIADLFG